MRERLRPYVMAQMKLAEEQGTPVMRPLVFDFDDPAVYDLGDQYMFGPDLLVAPVMDQGATRRDVYLPLGATWTSVWTGEAFEGGQTVTVDAPLEIIPLFLRDDAALPILG